MTPAARRTATDASCRSEMLTVGPLVITGLLFRFVPCNDHTVRAKYLLVKYYQVVPRRWEWRVQRFAIHIGGGNNASHSLSAIVASPGDLIHGLFFAADDLLSGCKQPSRSVIAISQQLSAIKQCMVML